MLSFKLVWTPLETPEVELFWLRSVSKAIDALFIVASQISKLLVGVTNHRHHWTGDMSYEVQDLHI